MHQQPRAPPRGSSPASSPQTNPARTNNPREGGPVTRPRTGSEVSGRSRRDSVSSPVSADGPGFGLQYESVKKLDQIIQNFYVKAAALILESRMKLHYTPTPSGNRKMNKWFQIETADFDDFREELRTWRTSGSFENRPPPMIVEVYLDTSDLTNSQSLVIVDEHGKRWDVAEALAGSDLSSGSGSGSSPTGESRRSTEVILERWRLELKTTADGTDDFGPILPTIYKKAIVFFRTLYLETRISPCWNYAQHARIKEPHPSLQPRCRIKASETEPRGPDRLRHPLYNTTGPVVEEFVLGDLEVPVGRFYASVAYRKDLNFRVDDSEKILSSRFMGAGDMFEPSLPPSLGRRQPESYRERAPHGHARSSEVPNQTYGSLSTFHGAGPLGTSPISALKNVPSPGSDTSSPAASPPSNTDAEVPHSMPASSAFSNTTRQPIRTGEAAARRPSVSFQSGRHPFKAGSLSGSPIPPSQNDVPASPQSQSRAAALASLTQARNRTSLTAGMPASLRGPAQPPIDVPMSSSPRPTSTSRYSSSFTHRRGRLSFSGPKQPIEDDQGSSGRQSVSSSVVQPGSGILAEAGAGGSSGSFQTDDDNISEFLKVLENKKSLKSFEPAKRGESATNRTVAQLSKFHMMKESNNQLTESMSSSAQMHRSLSSSSRQLMTVPGMVIPSSLSALSSPGKPLSPHTPHTPATPSRLAENSVIEYHQARGGQGNRNTPHIVPSGPSRENTITQEGTTAIDIPLSPRIGSHGRRSSSVAQQTRALAADDDENDLAFAHRSISLGAGDGDGDAPTRSMLRGRGEDDSPARSGSSGLQPAAEIRSSGPSNMMGQGSAEDKSSGSLLSPTSSSPFGRRRYMGMASAGRGQTPPQSSRGSYSGTTNRYGGGGNDVDDEPLLFDMSEMDAASRRSLEEGRGGGAAGSASSSDRGGLGTTRRGW